MIARALRFLAVLLVALPAMAADAPAAGKPEAAIRARLGAALPGVEITSVEPSPIAGMYQVVLDGSETAYVSADGTYVINGDLYQAGAKGLVNLTDQRKGALRKDLLAKVDRNNLIAFPAKGKEKAFVYVFTDVDCGYCRKFHQQVPELNAAGVSVYYLAFPRSGLAGDTFHKMEGVWCAGDRNKALTEAKRGVVPPVAPVACRSPVAEEYKMGVSLGIRGTPAIFLADGTQIGGYIPAKELIAKLGVK